MKLLNKISSAPRQQFKVIGIGGERIDLLMWFSPTQGAWMFNISWQGFTLNGAVMTLSPNILRGYRNNIPFGISCVSEDGIDPAYVDDFETGRVQLFILSRDEVQQIEGAMFEP